MLVDALLVRALLVPALVSLFGRWNWWLPRPARRAQGHTVAALKAIKVSLDEMNADIVAQREGFVRLIDRLDDGGQQQA